MSASFLDATVRANDGSKRRFPAILEATIDSTLLEGIAASAFLTDVDGADAVLAELFENENPAEVCARIGTLRAEQDFGLGQVPAPSERLADLRAELTAQNLDGFLVPLADEHQGEFIARRSQRLAWLTGFGGSAGMAIVLADTAAIFVDGRYTLQVRDQVDTDAFTPVAVAETSPEAWLRANLPKGARLGFDPWLHTSSGIARLRVACTDAGAELAPVNPNPVDQVWTDQAPAPLGPVMAFPVEHAGVASVEKRNGFSRGLDETKCVAAVLSAPDSIAWLLNIRGSDVPNTPLALGYAIVHRSGDVDWFIDERKFPPSVRGSFDSGISIFPPSSFAERLGALATADGTVRVDPASAPEWVRLTLDAAGASLSAGTDLCTLPKAQKNDVEVAGTRAAHIRDGAALTTFLAWLTDEAPKGGVSEISAADRLYECRRTDARFRGLSFDTISGSGPNGAIVHYRVTPETDRALNAGDVYLIDSGAQYLDGTTDVTRTVFVDNGKGASAETKDRYTRVLKGHIAVATARFPVGTHGSQIDALARLALWEAGLDYDHGTGHGVGSYLGVHEGPQRISKQGGGVAMEPGMILSNEPGYYKEGAYGIRIENLVVVTECADNAASERNMLEFETITLAPIDRNLVDRDLLTEPERDWLDAYHTRVRDTLSPLVDESVRKWLEAATAPI